MASVEQRPVAVEPPASEEGPRPVLFNPRSYDPADFDEATRRALLATIDFFESRGKATLKEHDHERTWYADFLEFVKRERIFATLLTPAAEAAGDPDKRWDTARICAFSEITGFYGLAYWYTWQVTILGLGPIWQSDNAAARRRAAELLEDGAIFAFGLSEKEHGADIYSTDMVLTPDGDGGFTASGSKYYIGNGNLAGMVSVFGRRADVEGPDGYVFFAADSRHPAYKLVKNVVNSQNYVSEFRLEDYPVRSRGHPAHRQGRLLRRAEHGQRRQVQPRLRLDRHLRARLLRGDHARRRPRPLRPQGHRVSRTSASC